MKKNKNIFEIINGSFKIQLIICVVLSTIVIIGFVILNSKIDKQELYDYTVTEDNNLINSIEDIIIDSDKLILDGYAFLLGKDASDTSVSLFLRNIFNGKEIWLDTKKCNRTDVNLYFSSEYNYEYSGFRASIKDNKLNDDECYEIIINLNYNENGPGKVKKTVSSNRFILNGQLFDYNPYEFIKPDLELKSELLRNVFNDGQLYVYQKEAGMYIYQYEGKLYWIATDDFNFNANGQTYIPYQPHTSQKSKLPADQVQYGFDNLDFYFEQYEYKDDITEPYRVAIREIPVEYPITYVRTGLYDLTNKTWLWDWSFHLDNLFN